MALNELKLVEEIYRFLRKWEGEYPSLPGERDIENLKKDLARLTSSSRIEIQKLSDLSPKFHRSLTVRELFNLTVPFERALSKTLRDDEFLVTSEDRPKEKTNQFPLVLILENLRSAFNVGSFFRLAESLNLQEVALSGYTATPENEKVQKTTMGTQEWIPWRWFSTTEQAILHYRDQGYRIVAIETSEQARDIHLPFPHLPTALVFGNERFGIDLETLRSADEIRQIPLGGQKNSLNVATCGAICSYEWVQQWKNIK